MTPITRTYDFTVLNIHANGVQVASPVDPVGGSFTVTFDPALMTIVNQTSDIVVNSFNVPLGSAIAFSYSASNTDELQFGGVSLGTPSTQDGTNNFFLISLTIVARHRSSATLAIQVHLRSSRTSARLVQPMELSA